MAQVPSSHWQPLEIPWQWLSLLTTRQKIIPLYTTELTIGSAEKSTLTLVKCSRIGSSCSCIILANNSTFLNAVNQNPWTPLMSAKKGVKFNFYTKGDTCFRKKQNIKRARVPLLCEIRVLLNCTEAVYDCRYIYFHNAHVKCVYIEYWQL